MPQAPQATMKPNKQAAIHIVSWSLCWLLAIFVAQLLSILYLNHGQFIYSLDDPYIHLSLARSIAHGWYGINPGEMSTPSSSILWPFLLVPFADTPIHSYIPLLFNITCLIGFVILLANFLFELFDNLDKKCIIILTVMLSLCTNQLGLLWLGMEHSLQVLLALTITLGLIQFSKGQSPRLPFYTALITAPLVRYELLALSLSALIYLYLNQHRKLAILSALCLITPLALFSTFLLKHGFFPLPNSVMLKLALYKTSLPLSYFTYYALPFVICLLALVCSYIKTPQKNRRQIQLIWLVITVMIAHFCFGAFGWLQRYAVYLYAIALPVLITVWRAELVSLMQNYPTKRIIIASIIALSLVFFPYVKANLVQPVQVSHQIYLQQFQLQRLVRLYGKPVAVNDIGLISYGSQSYVLDLFGLASPSDQITIFLSKKKNYLAELSLKADAHLVIIYESWFKNDIPNQWHKLGDLILQIPHNEAIDPKVSIYATSDADIPLLNKLIQKWQQGLPEGVKYLQR